MRKILVVLVAALVGIGSTLTLVAPAQAATGVTIKKIANPTPAAIGSTATIKPRYTKSGKVKIVAATLSVAKDGKSVARAKTSVRLKRTEFRDVYTVVTVVKYKVKSKGKYGKTKTKTLKQSLTVRPTYKQCATVAALESVVTSDMPGQGDLLKTVVQKLGEPFGLSGGLLGDVHAQATEDGDETTKAEIEHLYANGFTAETPYAFYGFEGCDDDAFYGVLVLGKLGSQRAYQVQSLSDDSGEEEQPPTIE